MKVIKEGNDYTIKFKQRSNDIEIDMYTDDDLFITQIFNDGSKNVIAINISNVLPFIMALGRCYLRQMKMVK